MTKRNRKTRLALQIEKSRAALQGVIDTAGSQQALGTQLGVTQAAISKWIKRGWVPLPRAREIEATFGVPRAEIADPKIVELLTPADFA